MTEMTDKQSPWRNPWVQGWIGLLVVFIAANIVMIYLAVSHSPGLVVDDYYERGQDYEKNMLKRQAKNPGWQMKVIAPERVDVAMPAVTGCALSVRMVIRCRPIQSHFTLTVPPMPNWISPYPWSHRFRYL